jgi:hypothetical protein
MTYVLYCFSILTGLAFRKNKLITLFILLTMYVFAAFKTTDADMDNYVCGYYSASDEGIYRYAGFTLFVKIMSTLQLDFEQYLCVFYLMVFGLMFIGIRKLTKNVNFVFASYLISCYAMDVVQMKSALADSIVLFAFAYYFGKSERVNKRRACITACILLLATFIHFSALFYLVAFFLYLILKGKKYYLIGILLITGMSFVFVSGIGLSIFLSMGSALGMLGNDNEYLSGWMDRNTRLGFLIPFLDVFFIAIPYWLLYNRKKFEGVQNTFNQLGLFMCTVVLMLPLLYLNVTFTRLFRIYLILSAVVVSNYGIRLKYKNYELFTLLLFFISLIYTFFIDTYQFWDGTLGALLNANALLLF